MKFLTPFLLIAATSAKALSSGSSASSLLPRTIQLDGGLAFPLVLSDGTLRVYYQADDTSIHSFEPFGLPGETGGTPTQDIQLLSPGVARANTPLSAVNTIWENEPAVLLYYFAGPSGDQLNEALGWTNGTGWGVTALGSEFNFLTTPGNQFLYAFPWSTGGPNSRRIGFPAANGSLVEAICLATTRCWYDAVF